MPQLSWPLGLIIVFGLGLAAGGWLGRGPLATLEVAQLRETEHRLQAQVSALRARLRDGDSGAAGQHGETAGRMLEAPRGSTTRPGDRSAAGARLEAYAGQALVYRGNPREAAAPAARATAPTAIATQAALDKFYLYLDEMSGSGGLGRWQRMQQLTDELRSMGPAGVAALAGVLDGGAGIDEQRAAAQLLGELQAAGALPLLQEILANEGDLPLRRAAASGLRRLEVPESIPVLEGLLVDSGEDRFIRMSAAAGLAQMGRSQGVAALMKIFEETSLDIGGRELTFRALSSLNDERPLPFMRRLATSNAEASFRLRAIRFLSSQGDRQALPSLQQIMNTPTESASIRAAASRAHAAIGGR